MNLIQFAELYAAHFEKHGAEWMRPIIEDLIQSGLTRESISAKVAEYNDLMFRPTTKWVDKGYYWSIRDRLKLILDAQDIFDATGKNIFEKS